MREKEEPEKYGLPYRTLQARVPGDIEEAINNSVIPPDTR